MPIILGPKKDGTYRMCTNYIATNNITIKYRYLISRLDDLIDKPYGGSVS